MFNSTDTSERGSVKGMSNQEIAADLSQTNRSRKKLDCSGLKHEQEENKPHKFHSEEKERARQNYNKFTQFKDFSWCYCNSGMRQHFIP